MYLVGSIDDNGSHYVKMLIVTNYPREPDWEKSRGTRKIFSEREKCVMKAMWRNKKRNRRRNRSSNAMETEIEEFEEVAGY